MKYTSSVKNCVTDFDPIGNEKRCVDFEPSPTQKTTCSRHNRVKLLFYVFVLFFFYNLDIYVEKKKARESGTLRTFTPTLDSYPVRFRE